jgi:hypothetical protein
VVSTVCLRQALQFVRGLVGLFQKKKRVGQMRSRYWNRADLKSSHVPYMLKRFQRVRARCMGPFVHFLNPFDGPGLKCWRPIDIIIHC